MMECTISRLLWSYMVLTMLKDSAVPISAALQRLFVVISIMHAGLHVMNPLLPTSLNSVHGCSGHRSMA